MSFLWSLFSASLVVLSSKSNWHFFCKVANRCKQRIQTAVTSRDIHSSLLDNKQGIAPENLYYLSVLCASAVLITDDAKPGLKLNCFFIMLAINSGKRQFSPTAFWDVSYHPLQGRPYQLKASTSRLVIWICSCSWRPFL